MRKLIRLISIVTVMVLCFTMTACDFASVKIEKYIIPKELSNVDSGVISENDNFALEWDDTAGCILLRRKSDNYIWSSTPYKAYNEGKESTNLNSTIYIEYYDLTDSSTQVDKSYACVTEGTVDSKLNKGTLCVTYYFEEPEITIPVYFSLEKAGLRATIKANEIIESGKTKLMAISFLPYFCSVENTDDKSAYLFVPTGSGALMYTDKEIASLSRIYSGEVYGTDGARHQLDVTENEEKITMPIFGAKSADSNAMFAIIEDGSEAARIDAISGNRRYGYSNVYPSFLVRGYDEIERIIAKTRSDAVSLAEKWSSSAVYSVCYFPLNGEEANYSGMARFYREYLKEKGNLKVSKSVQKPYQLEFIGGAQTKRFFLGVPYYSELVLTDYNDVLDIVKETKKETGYAPEVLLSGYGLSGADIGKIAGGYKLSNIYGSEKDLNNIKKYCKDNNVNIFMDFEVIYFTESGNGFNKYVDTAKTANQQSAAFNELKINTRLPDETSKKTRLLKRELLDKAVNKLINKFSGDFSGLGLGNLASVVYSDYTKESTYMKDATEEQVKKLVEKTSDSGFNVLLRSANSYAAGLADSVTDVSISNGNYAVFDETIPFYQIVFGGATPLYTTPINYASNQREMILKAVSSGTSLKYLLVSEHDLEVSDSRAEYFYSAEYSGLKKNIYKAVKETAPYYEAIKGSSIKNHTILTNDIVKTEFDNGINVYVNYSDVDVTIDGKEILAESFMFCK